MTMFLSGKEPSSASPILNATLQVATIDISTQYKLLQKNTFTTQRLESNKKIKTRRHLAHIKNKNSQK